VATQLAEQLLEIRGKSVVAGWRPAPPGLMLAQREIDHGGDNKAP
jgi:hypothetical protein